VKNVAPILYDISTKHGVLKQNVKAIKLDEYSRYDNPYVQASFPGNKIWLSHNNEWLNLNYETLEREASSFLGKETK